MDISSLSIAMPSSQINTGLDYVILSKALNTAEEAGDALEKMMAAAVTGLGGNIDVQT